MELLLLFSSLNFAYPLWIFTFQYGATTISLFSNNLSFVSTFTFQYGATTIPVAGTCKLPSPVFTFQYGATTIEIIKVREQWEASFTFQYGATTMRPLLNSDFLIVYPLFLSISIFCKFYRYFQIKYLDLFNP